VHQFRVAAVGDGLCARLQTGLLISTQVDCGSQQGGTDAIEGWLRLDAEPHPILGRHGPPDALIISHYHADHYSGLLLGAAARARGVSLNSRNTDVYGPGLPELPTAAPNRAILLRALLALSTYVAGSRTGHMEVDLIRAVQQLNNGGAVRYHRHFAGDRVKIHDLELRVLWPPRQLQDEELVAPMRAAIVAFEEALERNPRLRELDDAVQESSLFGAILSPEANETEIPAIPGEPTSSLHEWPRGEIPEEIVAAHRLVRSAANNLCLGFYVATRLLFLGDIARRQLKHVVNRLRAAHALNFDVCLAAHHGTLWNREMERVRADQLLVSNGPKLYPKFRQEWAIVSRQIKMTRLHGDIGA
jgi:hypothetical protein